MGDLNLHLPPKKYSCLSLGVDFLGRPKGLLFFARKKSCAYSILMTSSDLPTNRERVF